MNNTVSLVTVDVEPDDVWGNPYSRAMTNVDSLVAFQRLCDAYGVKPTYLLTYSVATDSHAARIVERLLKTGSCEVGAHSHMWEIPPFVERDRDGVAHVGAAYSPAEQQAKLETLTHTIAERFGAARSHRAGRFGIDQSQLGLLASLGYSADSSLVPGLDFSMTGAPDFRDASLHAFPVSDRGTLWEIPCTVRPSPIAGLTRGSRLLRRAAARAGLGPLWLRASPVGRPSGLLRVSRWAMRRVGFLNLMTHSSEFVAGTSPYWTDAGAVQRHWSTLETVFQAWQRFGVTGGTLSAFVRTLRANPTANRSPA